MEPIYLDYQATTPVDNKVMEEMLPFFTKIYGNASSKDHIFGLDARQAVENAREQIANTINAYPDEIIFTSGATEANNLALLGVAEKYSSKGNHIITCVTEHKAILDCCAYLEQQGKLITYLPVDKYGMINPEDVRQAITDKTILISIMAANNEIGTIAPIEQIGRIARENKVLFHTDAVQAFGHISLDVQKMNIDIMSLSAHKIYGPKGIGALYRKRSNPRVLLSPIIYGGGHEKGLRSGTLNVPSIVGFGKAATIALQSMEEENILYKKWTNYIYNSLNEAFSNIELNGHPTLRLAHNLNISLPQIESRALIVQLKNVALATGSACTSDKVEPSHVILSLDSNSNRAHSAIRISVGRNNDDSQIKFAVQEIISAVQKLKSFVD